MYVCPARNNIIFISGRLEATTEQIWDCMKCVQWEDSFLYLFIFEIACHTSCSSRKARAATE